MLAFQSDPAIKQKFVAMHRRSHFLGVAETWFDRFTTGKPGNGLKYSDDLGIPREVFLLQEAIHDGLDSTSGSKWPCQFLEAIRPGADLSIVWHQFAYWLLIESRMLSIDFDNRRIIGHIAHLHRRAMDRDSPSRSDWLSIPKPERSLVWEETNEEFRKEQFSLEAAIESVPGRFPVKVVGFTSRAVAAREVLAYLWSIPKDTVVPIYDHVIETPFGKQKMSTYRKARAIHESSTFAAVKVMADYLIGILEAMPNANRDDVSASR